jgi:hypothetical protein
MLLAVDLGQREEDLERELQTVGALWRVTCCSVALRTLVFLEEMVMDTLSLREYLQVAIKVEGANLGRTGRPVCLPTVVGLNDQRARAERMILRSTCSQWCGHCLHWTINAWPRLLSVKCSSCIQPATCPGLELLKSLRWNGVRHHHQQLGSRVGTTLMEIECGPRHLLMMGCPNLGKPSIAFSMDVLMELAMDQWVANRTVALAALTWWTRTPVTCESRAQCGATCTRGSVVTEIPLHFLYPLFSFCRWNWKL